MTTILLAILILLDLIIYLVIFDIILSWLSLVWIRFRPSFLAWIVDPMYNFIRWVFPTRIWMFDFTPIVIFLLIYFLKGLLFIVFPDLVIQVQDLLDSVN